MIVFYYLQKNIDRDSYSSLVFNRRSIDLGGAQEKEGHFHYKNFGELQNEVS